MSTQLTVIEGQLAQDRKLVSTFNGNRYDPALKWRAELQYALRIIRGNEQLQQCDPESIKLAMLEVAYSGLSLAPSTGHGYLIPYKNTCTFSPGYKGILHLLFKANTLRNIQPGLHKKGDPEWRVWTDENGKHITHAESVDHGRSKAETLHAYVIANFTSGGQHIQVLDQEELLAREKAASVRNPKGGMVWRSAFRPQMEIKAVIRTASSYWPRDTGGALEHAMNVLDKHDGLDFTSEPRNDEPQELLINDDQRLALHAALTDRELPDAEANDWLRQKAKAMGYADVGDIPARLFDKTRDELVARLEKVRKAQAERGAQ